MNPAYFGIFLVIFVILMQNKKRKQVVQQFIHKKMKKEHNTMTELAKNFIEKDCIIYTFDQHQHTGIIKQVNGNAILIENKGALEAINLDFISRIREYPRDKNGKKKSVILD